MQKTVYCRDSAGIMHASAVVSWDEGPEVSVSVSYNESSSWRIKPQGTSTSPVLTVTNGATSGSFNAVGGQTYVFQSIIAGSWANSYDGSGSFTVDFGGSGGNTGGDTGGNTGGSGGSSGTITRDYYLWVKADVPGVDISVYRTQAGSDDSADYVGKLTDGIEWQNEDGLWLGYSIWHNDYFEIHVTAQEGYVLYAEGIHNLDSTGNSVYWFSSINNDDPWIWPTVTLVSSDEPDTGLFVIGNGSKSARFRAYTFDGTEWVPGISSGNKNKVYSGTFTLDGKTAAVECGFMPDIVIIHDGDTYAYIEGTGYDIVNNTVLAIDPDGGTTRAICYSSHTGDFVSFFCLGLASGFGIYGSYFNSAAGGSPLDGVEHRYTAIKYT